MTHSALREAVFEANLEIVRRGLVLYTFGNASGIDRDAGIIAIKPSGVPYDKMSAADMVLVDLEGKVVEGSLRPSSDLKTHVVLYNAWPSVGGIVHTHSRHATAWAQAKRELPCFGTTHADYFAGPVPLTEPLPAAAIDEDYEKGTGFSILARFERLNPVHVPGVLVSGHAPFTWGKDPAQAAFHAVVLEELAALGSATLSINPNATPLFEPQRMKHFERKHGPNAYYGQKR